MKSKIDFLNSKTSTALMKMILPLFLAMVLMLAYGMVDCLWVGNLLGENGYAALTTSGAISIILNAIAMGISNGAAIVVSQLVGMGDRKRADSAVSTDLVLTGTVCVGLVILMECILPQLLNLFGTPENIYQDALSYLQIFILGYFCVYMYMQLTAIFRSYGDPAFQMLGMLSGTIMNAIADPVFIHFYGIKGAAWATALSQMVCLVFAILYAYKKKYFKFGLKEMNKKQALAIVKNAVPSCIQQCIPAISSMIMVILVNKFDVSTIAAYGVIKNIENILFYPAMAMNMGLMTIVGQCIGAGRPDKSKEYVKTACIFGGTLEAVMTILVVIFAGGISRAFVKSITVEGIVSHALMLIGIGYVCYMFTSIFMAELSGMGKPTLSMVLMFIYYIVIRVPMAILLVNTRLGLDGMWYAILYSHILAVIIGVCMLRMLKKKVLNKRFSKSMSESIH